MPRKRNAEEITMQEDIPTRAEAKKIFRNEKQKIAEERKEYVPVFGAKQTVEVPVKPKPTIEEIEKIETPKQSDQKGRQQDEEKEDIENRRVVKKVKTKPVETLKGNSILIITEKPQAALKIASALSDGKFEKRSEHNIPYYEFKHPKTNEHIIVACAVGHLFSLSQSVKNGGNYPIFEVSWKPNFEVRKKDFTKKYYSLLSKLIKRAKEIIIATDYDVEGEVIGYNIIRFIANQKDAKRMKFSSLTNAEIKEAFEKVRPTIDWGQAIAGETRHFIDWYYGINLSRALMASMKSVGSFKILSIGRVQGPALALIVDKERKIRAFKPEKYWQVFLKVKNGKEIEVKYIKDIKNKAELTKFGFLQGKWGEAKTEKKEQNIIPPYPFDLTTLQTEAYKFYKITPARTLQIAQALYLAGLISYPRTSSQKLPMSIGYENILKKLKKFTSLVKYAKRERPVEGSKSDPAHPAIFPVDVPSQLEGDEKKIYELIVRRFIACFAEDAIIENKKIKINVDGLEFEAKGLSIKEKGWMSVYSGNFIESELVDINEKVLVKEIRIEEKETQPPHRYSPASIVSELSKRNLGTKSTRATIIETLYERGYIKDQQIQATDLGICVVSALEKNAPLILDEKLTRTFEKRMDEMQKSKSNLEKKKQEILNEAKKIIENISNDFKKNEKNIGEELLKARNSTIEKEREENLLGKCHICEKGMLRIIFSKKTKKKFVGCSNYPECHSIYSLPQSGMVKKTDKTCECGFPLMILLRKGKKPWEFCFNSKCPKRQVQVQNQKSE